MHIQLLLLVPIMEHVNPAVMVASNAHIKMELDAKQECQHLIAVLTE